MWSCDPRRFTSFCDQHYTIAKGMEVYGHEYAMHFPRHAWPAGRPKKLSPLHERATALGAQYGAYNGWERANWYAKPGDDTSEKATQTWSREGPWHPRIREECLAVRDAAGLLDLPGFSRFKLEGEGSRDWLASMITGRVPESGRLGLGYFADDAGRIVTEMSILAMADGSFQLITAAAAQWHDRDWLLKHLSPGLTLSDETAALTCLLLTGPLSRTILALLTTADLQRPWQTHQAAEVAGRTCRLVRVSFAGELGWEIHSPPEAAPAIWDALMHEGEPRGLRPFGMFALDSLRLEKGYRAWKGDLSTDYTVLQAGLERFVDWTKPDFKGRAALLAEREAGPSRRFATLLVDAGDCDAPYMSTVWHESKVVGETTSGGWGHRIDKSIALAVVSSQLATPGTSLEVEIFGERLPATVQPDGPLWDPENARLRA
jgi:dimethylglycine dehydrogenase